MNTNDTETEKAVVVQSVTKAYGKQLALNNVSFGLAHREIVGLVGPNGAGKSTILRILKGGLYPTTGEVTIMGHSLRSNPDYIRRITGIVHEEPIQIDIMTGLQFLQFVAEIYGIRAKKGMSTIEYWVKALGMEQHIRGKIDTYSHGIRKRLSIMASLVHNPFLLLLDEPTQGMDPDTRILYMNRIMDDAVQSNRTVIVSSHRLDVVEKFCSRVLVIRNGRIVADSSPELLKEKYGTDEFEEAYLSTNDHK